MKRFAISAIALVLATGAFAHSKMETTTPENGAVVAEPPAEISLNFVAKIRLTRVEMTHQERHTVPLDLGDQTSFDQSFSVPLQGMGSGSYRIDWRGLGVDGHAMKGSFAFTVD